MVGVAGSRENEGVHISLSISDCSTELTLAKYLIDLSQIMMRKDVFSKAQRHARGKPAMHTEKLG